MTPQDRQSLDTALAREFGRGGDGGGCPPEHVGGLERLVGAGARRLGVRADRSATDPRAVNACLLAPPLARLIDHTLLKPESTDADVLALCDEARQHCFASVCVSPVWVPLAAEALAGATSRVCTVVGFPHGAQRTPVKAFETTVAVRDGAEEIDMVLGIGRLKSRRYDEVEADIQAVVEAAGGCIVKVILETALLTDEEKVIACVLAQNAGADFVKTSTGFAAHGAKPEDIALMRRVVGDRMGVKASGGIRSAEDAAEMVEHGATRLGASASVAILKGLTSEASY
ncbi:MAG: deoxyribose-phosphate aldolase [Rubricoccaceae bacterium]|nr:deoxyribose-phosphate aldolase [Rubricoccaceae bacterium]